MFFDKERLTDYRDWSITTRGLVEQNTSAVFLFALVRQITSEILVFDGPLTGTLR